MDRLKLMLTMFSVVFLFGLASNAQDNAPAAEALAPAAAPVVEGATQDAPAVDHSKMDHGKMDHSKMDHGKMGCTGGKDCGCEKCRQGKMGCAGGKDCGCKKCRHGKKSAWKWKGKTDFRMNHRFGDNGSNDLFVRGMLSGKANIDDTFHSKISIYGQTDFYGMDYSGMRIPVGLYQAWVKWSPNEMFRVKAGLLDTSFFGYTNLYEEVPETLTGAVVKVKSDFVHVSALYARRYEYGVSEGNDFNLDYYGLNVKITQLPEFISKIKLSYYLQAGLDEDTIGGLAPLLENLRDKGWPNIADDRFARQKHMFGGLVKAGLEGFKVKGKFFWQQAPESGGDESFNANVVHAKASYTIAQALNTTVWAGYHRDSDQFQPFFYDKHSMAGYGDILELGNLTYFNFGLKVVPVEGVHVGAGYHIFSKTNSEESTNFYNAPKYLSDADTTGDEGGIGNELDFWVKKKFKHGISAKLRYVNFNPGDALNVEDSDNRVELRLVSKF